VPEQAITAKPQFHARRLVPTLALASFVNHLNVVAWIPFLPFMAEAHRVSVSLLGQIPALMLLLSAFLGLVIGPLADRYGYRRTLRLCLVAVAMSSLTAGLSPTLSALLLAALPGAMGRAAVMPVAQAAATAFFVEVTARRRAISRIQSGARGCYLGHPGTDDDGGGAQLAWRIHHGFGTGTRDRGACARGSRPGRGCEQR